MNFESARREPETNLAETLFLALQGVATGLVCVQTSAVTKIGFMR